jgi:lipopolysaccharide biosynthesis regulator YciM
MIDLLWLLLPIAAASGWFAARRQERQGFIKSSLSHDHFKGLNHQLNEEPDKAIDVFIDHVNKDTAETLIGLGIFFRRSGEINRAIRIHQNIISSTILELQQRYNALFELAQDYRYAGLLDRAENLFQKLIASENHKALALRELLALYQQEHDWEKAIRTALQRAKLGLEGMHTEIAQYYCEQAEDFQQQGQSEAAQQAIQNALKADPKCVRASLLEGKIALEKQLPKQAILAFQRVEQQDPDYITEMIGPLQTCYQKIGQQQELTHYLQHLLEQHGCIRPMLALANIIKQQEPLSFDLILKNIQNPRSSIGGVDLLLDLALSKKDGISRDHLLLLKEMTTQLLKNQPAYQCTHCGLTARKLYWQCPSCLQWNSVKPL